MKEWLDMYPPGDNELQDRSPKESRPPASRKKLRKQSAQGSLDLHGFTVEEAGAEVEIFLDNAKRRGLRKVLIIHGKGYHSQGKPVLKREVIKILENSPVAGEFGTADRKEGGSGALWVLLK